jgi:hypothetical protein
MQNDRSYRDAVPSIIELDGKMIMNSELKGICKDEVINEEYVEETDKNMKNHSQNLFPSTAW